ncbi:alcohol dehydrogenase GroES-like domain-containing protein [Apiospora arundinis]
MTQQPPPPSIPDQMQAIQVVQRNQPYQLRTVPVPFTGDELGPHDLLVKVAAASYCHTDGMVAAGVFGEKLPITASHEGAGTVVRAGNASGFRVGDRVMCGQLFHPCGVCGDCRGGRQEEQYCTGVEGTRRRPYRRLLRRGVSLLDAAPLACAGRTVWRAVQQVGLQRGQWVAIVGSGGGLGHLGIQFAQKALGLRVIGIEARDEGLELSREFGADAVLDARKDKAEVVAEAQKATEGSGADATIVLSDAKGAAALGCAVTRMHGTVVQVAQPDKESRSMLEAVAEHGIEVKTNVFRGLESIDELMAKVKEGKIQGKAVILVDQEQIDAEK